MNSLIDCPLYLMTSGGGMTTLAAALGFPVRLVESGPSGGAILAAGVARSRGCAHSLVRDRTDATGYKSSDMNADIIADIVTFWLRDSRDSPDRARFHRGWWYEGSPAVDEEIRARFGDLIPRACARELMGWRSTPEGALALILLLDQFTRNVHRGTVGAYAGDPCAFEVVNHAIDRGLDRALHPVAKIWLYHPFHHSEVVAEQDRGLGLLRELRRHADSAWHAYVERSIKGWTRHRNIVARFGRFPHRNAVLGRDSTAEELAYMAAGGRSFGQGPSKGSAAR